MRFYMRGAGMGHWGYGGYVYMRFHTDAVSKRESLNSQKQKRLSHYSPAALSVKISNLSIRF